MLIGRTQAQAAAASAGDDFQPRAGQAESHIETRLIGADNVADINLPGDRPDFKLPLTMRTTRAENAEFGIEKFVASIQQVQCRQIAAAQRTA